METQLRVRLAGYFVVISSVISPWIAALLMHPWCYYREFVPTPAQVVPVDVRCDHFSVHNATCTGSSSVYKVQVQRRWQALDPRCPTSVLQLYSDVWITGLIVQVCVCVCVCVG